MSCFGSSESNPPLKNAGEFMIFLSGSGRAIGCPNPNDIAVLNNIKNMKEKNSVTATDSVKGFASSKFKIIAQTKPVQIGLGRFRLDLVKTEKPSPNCLGQFGSSSYPNP